MQCCTFAPRRASVRRFALFQPLFWEAARSRLAELALAYTIFPNGGWRPNAPHILERIEEKDGTLVWDGKQQSIRKLVTKPETAYEIHSCLADALQSGTGKAAFTAIWPEENARSGKNRHSLRFH